jgi:hypothetical protein
VKLQKATIILSITPTTLFLSLLYLTNVRGPYYYGLNFDPAYAYLFNSLNLALFTSPHYIDHPGTTVQEIGSLIIITKWLFGYAFNNFQSVTDSVLINPEDYLQSINLFFNLIFGIAVFWVAYKFYSFSNSLAASIILQLSLLIFSQTLIAQTNVASESLLIIVSLILIIPIILVVFSDSINRQIDCQRYAIASGIIMGCGLATKFTFFPLLAIGFLFKNIFSVTTFYISSILSFFIFTLPIISKMPRFINSILSLISHKGSYGTGKVGIPSISSIYTNLTKLFWGEPLIFIIMFYGIIFSTLISQLPNCIADNKLYRINKLLWLTYAIIAIQIAVTLKCPDSRYLLPSFVLISLVNASIVVLLTQINRRTIRNILVIAGIIIMVFGFISNFIFINNWLTTWHKYTANIRQLATARRTISNCLTISYYRSSIPEYALAFGNAFADYFFNAQLSELYPNDFLFYNIGSSKFYSFKGDIDNNIIYNLLNDKYCIIMQGTTFDKSIDYKEYSKKLNLEMILETPDESIYRLINIDN